MKKLFLIAIMLVGFISQAQEVELKGYYLGKVYSETTVHTTLGGIVGLIYIEKLNDGRTFSLGFIPSDDGELVTRIYETDVDRIINGIESKFGVKMEKLPKEHDEDSFFYHCEYNGIRYLAVTDYNPYMSPTTEFTMFITDVALNAINDIEQQEKANDDF